MMKRFDVVVVGTGPALGLKVTLVEKRDRMLEFVDREIVDALTYHMRDHGVLFRLGEEEVDCSVADGQVVAHTASRKTIVGDCLGTGRYGETARGQILADETGRLKLLVHADTRQVLGVHIIGEGATELVHIGQAVIALGGTLDYLVGSVFNYPTLAECYKIAALDAYNRLAARGARPADAAA
jgi:pyruvate/2-oxoglutarate dehydrogenase complex dihydrolipoamide dehydrogenase (E3) component